MNTTGTPRVWIGCLAAYNAGALHGEWVDATDADEMNEARDRVIKTSPAWKLDGHAEEWFIADYDGFGSVTYELGEYADFERVAEVGRMIAEYGEEFIAYLSVTSVDEGLADFEEARQGAFDSEKDFAMDLCDQLGKPPEQWAPYIDWDAYARSLFQHGDFVYADGYVFRTVYS